MKTRSEIIQALEYLQTGIQGEPADKEDVKAARYGIDILNWVIGEPNKFEAFFKNCADYDAKDTDYGSPT